MSDSDEDWERVLQADEECKRTYSKWQDRVAAELRGECTNEAVDACYDIWRIAMDDAVALRVNWYKRYARADQQSSVDDQNRDSA